MNSFIAMVKTLEVEDRIDVIDCVYTISALEHHENNKTDIHLYAIGDDTKTVIEAVLTLPSDLFIKRYK